MKLCELTSSDSVFMQLKTRTALSQASSPKGAETYLLQLNIFNKQLSTNINKI